MLINYQGIKRTFIKIVLPFAQVLLYVCRGDNVS